MKDISSFLPSRIEFVSVVTAIKDDGSCFTLVLQNFVNGKCDTVPYLAEFQYTDTRTKAINTILMSLFCQMLGLGEIASQSTSLIDLQDIYLRRLCFIKINGSLTKRDTYYHIEPDDIIPLTISKVVEYANAKENSIDGKVLHDTIESLIKMNDDIGYPFKFKNLENYEACLSEFVRMIRESKVQKENSVIARNPIFGALYSGPTNEESLNDFNSQLMSSESYDSMNSINITKAIDMSSNFAASQESPNKKIKIAVNEESMSMGSVLNLSIGTEKEFCGKIFGSYPPKIVEGQRPTQIYFYFIPKGWPYDSTLILIPNGNCIEVSISEDNEYYELFFSLLSGVSELDDILMLQDITVILTRVEKEIKEGLYTAVWSLTSIDNADIPKDFRAPEQIKTMKRDPTISLSELKLSTHDVKYVNIFGLLVSCSFESRSYVKMVFTDFTTTHIPQKYLLDPYLIDFDNKLHSNEGFRAIMYLEQFEEFNRLIKKEFNGRSIKEMYLQGAGSNVSHRGIVCRVLLKVNLYGGKLNAIIRDCHPITYAMKKRLASSDPIAEKNLTKLYHKAVETIPAHSLGKFLHFYNTCFPMLDPDENSDRLVIASSTPDEAKDGLLDVIPSLNIEDPEEYELDDQSDLSILNQSCRLSVVYPMEAHVIAVDFNGSRLRLLVTNSMFQQDFIDPTRVVRIDIIGPKNLMYFFNTTTNHIDPDVIANLKKTIIDEELTFKITRGVVTIYNNKHQSSGLMVWCPLELTLQEIRSQLNRNQPLKKEQDSSHYSSSTIKQEE